MSVPSAGMRKFTERYKLTALSLVEIRRGLKVVTDRLVDRDVQFDGHIIAHANVLNAVALWFLKQPVTDQDRIVLETLPDLLEHKKSATPLAIEPSVSTAGKRRTYRAGHKVIQDDAQSENRIAGDVNLPKRGR